MVQCVDDSHVERCFISGVAGVRALQHAVREMLHHALIFIDAGDRVDNGVLPVTIFLDNYILRARQKRVGDRQAGIGTANFV